MTPCNVIGYQRFGGSCCLRVQGDVKMQTARPSETSVTYYKTTRSHSPEDSDLGGGEWLGSRFGRFTLGGPDRVAHWMGC
jgi:hypothetical protein